MAALSRGCKPRIIPTRGHWLSVKRRTWRQEYFIPAFEKIIIGEVAVKQLISHWNFLSTSFVLIYKGKCQDKHILCHFRRNSATKAFRRTFRPDKCAHDFLPPIQDSVANSDKVFFKMANTSSALTAQIITPYSTITLNLYDVCCTIQHRLQPLIYLCGAKKCLLNVG